MNRTTFTILGLITLGLLSWGLHQALVVAPTEQTMGNIQRIFYYHFPSAMTAFKRFSNSPFTPGWGSTGGRK